MINRPGTLLLALLYIITVAGFALNLHYCGNRVADVKINSPAKSCLKQVAKSNMNCCKDSQVTVKIKDSHQKGSNSFISRSFVFDLPKFTLAYFLLPAHKVLSEKLYDKDPPDIPVVNTPLFIKNCIFRV